MSNQLLPCSIAPQPKLDSLDWADGASFTAFGLRFGVRTNDAALLAQAIRCAPMSWRLTSIRDIDVLYSIYRESDSPASDAEGLYSLYCDSALVLNTPDRSALLSAFENHAQLLTAYRAQDCLFVHAGVVGWHEQAIVIPGRTLTGKTTLVRALVQSGATYYSDEFAVLDKDGRVHPYAVPLSIRVNASQPGIKTPIESLGGRVGTEPLPLGLIVVTQYAPQAKWRPQELSPAQAILAMMDNTVAAQREPQYTMPILRAAVMSARTVKSKRGEAEQVVRILLRMLK
jgi:hypothetical protein